MKTDPEVRRRILRDALLSVVFYALPVILMLLSFLITGERPWKTHQPPAPADHTAAHGD